jgi:hypothetical protein
MASDGHPLVRKGEIELTSSSLHCESKGSS